MGEWMLPRECLEYASLARGERRQGFALALLTQPGPEEEDQSLLVHHAKFDFKLPLGRNAIKAVKILAALIYNSIMLKESKEVGTEHVHNPTVVGLGNIVNCALRDKSVGHAFVRELAGCHEDLPASADGVDGTSDGIRRVVAPYMIHQTILGLQSPNIKTPFQRFMSGAFGTLKPWRLAQIGSILGLSGGTF